MYRLGSREDALDAVQDAMMMLARRYASKPECEWRPLFYRILTNRIRDLQRRSNVRRAFTAWRAPDDADAPDPVANAPDPSGHHPEKISAIDEAVGALDAAIGELAPRQQQALLLRLVEGLDVAQTASAMNCSQGSVKTHYSRAVHTLRKRLGEHWP